MSPCSHNFLLRSLYNKIIMAVGLTMSAWFLDSELSTCFKLVPLYISRVS